MSQVVVNVSLIDKAVKYNLTIQEIVILHCLVNGWHYLVDAYVRLRDDEQKKVIMQSLVRKNLLSLRASGEFKLENYELTEYGKAIVGQNIIQEITGIPVVPVQTTQEKSAMDLLVENYLEMFPKGIKNGGNKPLRSNATDVRAKLLKFMNKYQHRPETILKATKNYLDRMRGIYTYCPTAEYFILKDGSSALATECDMVKNGLSNEEIINPFEKRM